MHCSNGSNGSRALSAVWMALSRACLWSPALAPRCQHARPHRTTVKHTVGSQRFGKVVSQRKRKIRNHSLPAEHTQSPAPASVPRPAVAVHFKTLAKRWLLSSYYPHSSVDPVLASTHHHRTRNRRGNGGGPLVGGVGCAGLIDAWIAC